MIYLDNAATSFPKPTSVIAEVNKCITTYCANPGRSSHKLSLQSELKIYECRELLCKLLNIDDPFRIIFTKNTTEGLNIAIKSLLKSGDHVITSMIEHNSVLRPLNALKEQGVELTILPVNSLGYISITDISSSIKKNTKAVIINHGSNVLGTVQDIEAISTLTKSKGILLIVDGAQTIGLTNIDVKKLGIDILAFPGHKSLFGLQGIGGLYISKAIEITPLMEGGTGSNSNSMIQPTFLPDSLESGTLNTPGIVSLGEGVKFIFSVGQTNILQHEISLMSQLTDELRKLKYITLYGEINPMVKTPVLSFNIDGLDSSEAGALYSSQDICIRTSYHCAPLIHKIIGTELMGTIRVSPSYFNTPSDIDKFIKITRDIYNRKI